MVSSNHRPALSINSISSLVEPTTPPNYFDSAHHQRPAKMTPSVVVAGPTSPSTGGDSLQHLNVGSPRTRSVSSSTSSSTSTTGEGIGSPPNNSTLSSVNDSSLASLAPTQTKSLLWDQAKPHQNLNLPSFNLDLENLTGHNHQQRASVSSLSGVVFDASSGPSNYLFALSQQQLGAGAPPVVAPTDASNGFSLHQQQSQSQSKYSGVVPPSNKFTQASKSSSVSSASSIVSSSATSFTSYASGATPLIDKEYLASINKVPLLQLRHEILRFSKDQYGCRFLQKKIDENIISNYSIRLANFEIIFKEIHPYLYELIIDPFGNYLIQKLTMYCNESNLNLMMEILQSCLFQISINQHGTRALQKIIDNLSNDYQLSLLIKGLKPYIIELIKDLNGNHVIQKILNKYSPENCQFIYDSIIQDLFPVATHKHGCCVLQKCLNHATHNQLMDFSNAILNYPVSVKLVNDQFGNYVLQYLISIDSIDINYRMFENFMKFGVSELCNLKFSSNVVEKFLKNCYNNEPKSMEFSQLKFDLIFNILSGNLNKLINDPYGNYVIQTLLDILVHTQVVYPPDLPGLLALQPDYRYNVNGQMSQSNMQISIIKHWFQNCKIVSSYGKRIQSKINTILNNSNNSSGNTVIGNHHHSMNRNTTHMNNNVAASYNNGNNNNNSNIPMNMNYLQENMTSTGQFINSNNYYYASQQQPQPHQQQHQQQQIHMPQHQLLPNHIQQQQQQFMSAPQFSNGGHPLASRRQIDHQGQRSSQQMPPRTNVQYNYRGMPPQQYMAPYQPNSMMNDNSNKSTINGHSMNGGYGQRYY